jgi:hypothetical protein
MPSCGRCGAEWPGESRAHCSACHETYNSVSLFDEHRRDDPDGQPGDGICVTLSNVELTKRVWHRVLTDAQREKLAALRASRS